MTGEQLPAPPPTVTPETELFWRATAQGRLLIPRCDDCGTSVWYPRRVCTACGGRNLTWTEATGRGVVYSYTRCHVPAKPYKGIESYFLAYVRLEEGVDVMTNIVGATEVYVGQPVTVVFSPVDETAALPRFTPTTPP
ncbi:Zn-ribbon domain-containing OB-fold protein [Amycolatopsis pigmentata]|uniref:Zn-ribbon domain-containing OB-fold protein n=1 Tax=Amycolatopsis pigmentata TaxID=450801 RepID=A0ABW5G5F1_9PSEU